MFKKLLVLICFISGCSMVKYDIKQSFKSVVQIYMTVSYVNDKKENDEDGVSGTAWAIDDNHLITAGHVCERIQELRNKGKVEVFAMAKMNNRFYVEDYEASEIQISLIDREDDICILTYSKHGILPLKLAEDNPKFYDKIYIPGAPQGLLGYIFDGRVVYSDVDLTDQLKGKILVSAPSTHGDSGAPILNENGEVVGILIMASEPFDHLSIGTGLKVIKRVLKIK